MSITTIASLLGKGSVEVLKYLEHEYDALRAKCFRALFIGLVVVAAAFVLNIKWGLHQWNVIPLIGVLVWLFMFATKYQFILGSGALGALEAHLGNTDRTQGILSGLKFYATAYAGVGLWVTLVLGTMTIIPFEKNRHLAVPILVGLLILAFWSAFFQTKTKLLETIVFWYGGGILLVSAIMLVGGYFGFKMSPSEPKSRLQNLMVQFNEDALRNKIWVLTDAKWERPRDEDGALPTGVRSEAVQLPVGCNIQFPDGWGHAFTVWAKNTNPGNGASIEDWKSYSITAVDIVANEYAFEIKIPNAGRFNYLITCPKGTWVPKESSSMKKMNVHVGDIRQNAD